MYENEMKWKMLLRAQTDVFMLYILFNQPSKTQIFSQKSSKSSHVRRSWTLDDKLIHVVDLLIWLSTWNKSATTLKDG